jgi:hypothetical protein
MKHLHKNLWFRYFMPTLIFLIVISLDCFAENIQTNTMEPELLNSLQEEDTESLQKIRDAAREAAASTFGKVLPSIKKAKTLFDKHDNLPDKGKIPFISETKDSNEKSINSLLDDAAKILSINQVTDCRKRITYLQEQINKSQDKIEKFKQDRVSAPAQKDLEGLIDRWNPLNITKEGYDEKIASEEKSIKEAREEISNLKYVFARGLRAMGMTISDDEVETLLFTVSGDDFVAMAVAFDNVKYITEQLRILTEESGESSQTAKQYYGMYVILAKILDRIQKTYVFKIENDYISRLKELAKKANNNIDEARQLISTNSGDKKRLEVNIEANQLTINAINNYIVYLENVADAIKTQNKDTEKTVYTAVNTYKTVNVSENVAQLIATGAKDFEKIMNLKIPQLRAINNDALRKEYERLNLQLNQDK